MWTLALTQTYLWSTNNGKASWTPGVCQRHWQGTKTSEWQNHEQIK